MLVYLALFSMGNNDRKMAFDSIKNKELVRFPRPKTKRPGFSILEQKEED